MKLSISLGAFLFSTFAMSMSADQLQKANAFMTSVAESNDPAAREVVTVVIKNSTGIPIKLRGRFGELDKPPIGYICDEENTRVPQVFFLNNGHGIKFSITKQHLPLRVRAWQVDFDPDHDMESGMPVDTSERNTTNTLFSFVAGNQHWHLFNNSKKIINITWNSDAKTYHAKPQTLHETVPLKLMKATRYTPIN